MRVSDLRGMVEWVFEIGSSEPAAVLHRTPDTPSCTSNGVSGQVLAGRPAASVTALIRCS